MVNGETFTTGPEIVTETPSPSPPPETPVEATKAFFKRDGDRWEATFPIVKIDDDKMQAFGWASVVTDDLGRIIIDHDDDVIPVPEIEKAAYAYVKTSRKASEMHVKMDVADLIESVVLTQEKRKAMDLPSGRVGWWVGFQFTDKAVWAKVKSRELEELSIGGRARRVERAQRGA